MATDTSSVEGILLVEAVEKTSVPGVVPGAGVAGAEKRREEACTFGLMKVVSCAIHSDLEAVLEVVVAVAKSALDYYAGS